MIRITAVVLPIALLAGCATQRTAMPASPAQPSPAQPAAPEHALVNPAMPGLGNGAAPAVAVAGTVYIYRGMPADPQTGKIDWSQASFGISGGTLSFFDAHDATRPCWLKIKVDAPNVPVQAGAGGTIAVQIPAAGIQQPLAASPWPAVFDNNPLGHWSIAKVTLGPSNAKAQINASLTFKNTADLDAATVGVVNGALQNCQK